MLSAFRDDPEMAMILGDFVGRLDAQIAAMQQAYADDRCRGSSTPGTPLEGRRRLLRLSAPDRDEQETGGRLQGP